ncbi:hypothetical protein ACIGB6_10190 [Paeniglutamicibacter gangotriensis]|uniref:hypothetical protein n=1 Tax=Paeniglutamicibacter gangotriensis TaxID=254787 RepID=UPI0037CAA21E
MSDLEARIAEVLVAHGQHDYRFNGGNWSDNCACGFKLFGIDYSPEHKVFPGTSYADCAHAAHQTAMLAPAIREREIDVWDECDNAWTAAHKMSNYDPWEFLPDGNPYRADNLDKP